MPSGNTHTTNFSLCNPTQWNEEDTKTYNDLSAKFDIEVLEIDKIEALNFWMMLKLYILQNLDCYLLF